MGKQSEIRVSILAKKGKQEKLLKDNCALLQLGFYFHSFVHKFEGL